jgi:alpha-mannosidase
MESMSDFTRRCSGIALLVVACTIGACGGEVPVSTNCPPPGVQPVSETCVRKELGIPDSARRVLILSQSSHLDWDWLRTFDAYYQQSVDGIFTDAFSLLAQHHDGEHHYYYSVAEMGFLERFVTMHPDVIDTIHAVGNDLRIVGGGITSPDNLLPHGETFIRDYLVGKTWVDSTLALPIRAAWLPDDFGHDAQLPVVLEAMGLSAVGFARVPGVDTSGRFSGLRPPPADSLAADLLQTGIDFVWQGADGSEVLAHWMPQSYCQGDKIDLPLTSADDPLTGAKKRMHQLLKANDAASLTPYIFVPIGCDFTMPKRRLLDYVDAWNASEYASTGVWAVAATFDHYAQLIAPYRDRLPKRHFDPTPYWTGYYASRPELKTLHLAATQALLGAEVFGALADGLYRASAADWTNRVTARTQAMHRIWEVLVPSNHHDFITGTALDDVYQSEQLPRLSDALSQAEAQRDSTLDELAAGVAATPRQGEQPVAVFNQLGFARTGLVEISDPARGSASSVRTESGESTLVQPSAEGGLLFRAPAPSFGFETAYLQTEPPIARTGATLEPAPVSLTSTADGAVIVMENAALRAVVTRDSGWALTSLIDKATGSDLIAPDAIANAIVIYADQGGLYRFGNEMSGCTLTPASDGARVTEALPAEILEQGPLRARLRTQVVIAGQTYEKSYALVADEAFLRMSATGAAPAQTSVMVQFPLVGGVDEIVHGTPYHWDRKAPERAGDGLSFEATHDFVIPRFGGRPLAAIFHGGVPAWAVQSDGVVIGALWRNARQEQCDIYGASGTDADAHTLDYALRVPSGIEPPETGAQLREALAFHTPLQARIAATTGPLPPQLSLASVGPDPAILTAAKSSTASPRDLILRIYQPTNATLPVEVTTAAPSRFPVGDSLTVQARTALETHLDAATERALGVRGDPAHFDLTTQRAVTTVAITDLQ